MHIGIHIEIFFSDFNETIIFSVDLRRN